MAITSSILACIPATPFVVGVRIAGIRPDMPIVAVCLQAGSYGYGHLPDLRFIVRSVPRPVRSSILEDASPDSTPIVQSKGRPKS